MNTFTTNYLDKNTTIDLNQKSSLTNIWKFIFRISKKIIIFIWKLFLDFIVVVLYNFTKFIWEVLYEFESWLCEQLKKSKYIKDDRFDPGIERERIIMLWMWLQNAKKITEREVSRETWVSRGYARQMIKIAKNHMDYYREYADIWKEYISDCKKRDKRSFNS